GGTSGRGGGVRRDAEAAHAGADRDPGGAGGALAPGHDHVQELRRLPDEDRPPNPARAARACSRGGVMSLHADDVRLHGLTAAERQRFDEDGFFIVPDALDPSTVDALCAVADGSLDRLRERGADEHAYLNRHDVVGRHPLFLSLMTWPTVFHKVWQVLGGDNPLVPPPPLVAATRGPSLAPAARGA